MFSVSKFIHLPAFIVSFAVGVLFVYLYNDEKRTILVYPRPDNVGELAYRDPAGACFYFKETEVVCPEDEDEITKFPHQG